YSWATIRKALGHRGRDGLPGVRRIRQNHETGSIRGRLSGIARLERTAGLSGLTVIVLRFVAHRVCSLGHSWPPGQVSATPNLGNNLAFAINLADLRPIVGGSV